MASPDGRKVVDLDWTDALMLAPYAFLRKAGAAFAYGSQIVPAPMVPNHETGA